MEWVPGEVLGKGKFSTVRLATPKKKGSCSSPLMAVKSSNLSHSDMLLHEKSVLAKLKHCDHIIRCLGLDHTEENGECNLFLEYASGGTLGDKLKKQINGKFQEPDIRQYTKSILEGVYYIHKHKYVHRDLKPENVLLSSSNSKETVKIADFGIAKRSGEKNKRGEPLGGTFGYPSPEALAKYEQEPPSDVWAVGCIVAEMFTGSPVWQCRQGENVIDFVTRMASEMPEFDSEKISSEGRDFLGNIFVKDPAKRWTAKMLLDHPFVANKGHHRKSIVEKFRRMVTCPIVSSRIIAAR